MDRTRRHIRSIYKNAFGRATFLLFSQHTNSIVTVIIHAIPVELSTPVSRHGWWFYDWKTILRLFNFFGRFNYRMCHAFGLRRREERRRHAEQTDRRFTRGFYHGRRQRRHEPPGQTRDDGPHPFLYGRGGRRLLQLVIFQRQIPHNFDGPGFTVCVARIRSGRGQNEPVRKNQPRSCRVLAHEKIRRGLLDHRGRKKIPQT